MDTYAVYLRPRCALAGGIHSDTLFGALCWAIRAVYGVAHLEALLESPDVSPPFAISSTFPCLWCGDQKVRFYPKPLLPNLHSDQVGKLAEGRARYGGKEPLAYDKAVVDVVAKAKRTKVACFVSEELFREVVWGNMDTEGLFGRLMDGRGSMDRDIEWIGDGLITTGERKRIDPDAEHNQFWRIRDVQRNEIDRVAGATVEGRLFFVDGTVFAWDVTGLWFVLRTNDADTVRAALRYLEDTGIGRDRSVGMGHFRIEMEQFNLPEAEDPNAFVSLSRYIPFDGASDFGGSPLSYHLLTIRPKHEATFSGTGHHTYKATLRMFAPGSIFPLKERRDVYGRTVCVGANAEQGGWNVWHNGITIPVFARIGGDGDEVQ